MEINHIPDILNKPTDKGYIAHEHTTRIINTYQHWPKETHKATQAKLSTLRVLSYIQNIPGAELEHILNIQATHNISTSISTSTQYVDEIRAIRH